MLPTGINDAGQVVGIAHKLKEDPWTARNTFLIEDGVIYELANLLVNPEDWSGRPIFAINNSGWVYGTNYVAIPVEQP